MTVDQLIKRLEVFDPALRVFVVGYYGSLNEVDEVEGAQAVGPLDHEYGIEISAGEWRVGECDPGKSLDGVCIGSRLKDADNKE